MDAGFPKYALRASASSRLGDFLVIAVLVPAVDGPAASGDIAFLVEGDRTEHRVPGAGAHDRRDLLSIKRAGLGGGLRPDLKGGVGVEDITLRIDALVLELLDDGCGGGALARIGREGEQHALAGGAGD